MSIIRRKDRQQFLVVDQRVADDMAISLQARGLLFYLLGRPDDWTVNVTHLANTTGHTRKVIYKLVNELIEAGYLKRSQEQNISGKFQAVIYDVIESPGHGKPIEQCTQNRVPQNGEAVSGKAVSGTLTNTDIPNTDIPKEKELCTSGEEHRPPPKKRKVFTKPTPEQLTGKFINKGLCFNEAQIEADKFISHYESNGWKVGKNKMVSWPHAVNNWMNRKQESDNEKRNRYSKDNRTRGEFHADNSGDNWDVPGFENSTGSETTDGLLLRSS